MRFTRQLFILFSVLIMAIGVYAQDDAAPTAFVLEMGDNGIPRLGAVTLPGASIRIDWNPIAATNYARVDENGIMRYSPINTPEGVYSFAPSFDGFSVPSRSENRLFVDEVKWSPNGQQFVFRIASGNEQGNDGVWYWQPAQETVTDPSYHLLRDCPPGCHLVNSRDTAEWKSVSMDWSPDNVAILVHLYLPEEERQAIGLIFASRDPQSPQADIQPPTYRYAYGSWAVDGQRLVVSGEDPSGNVVFGFLNRDGTNPVMTSAASVGLVSVRNAVESPATNEIIMLGSTVGETSPVALYKSDGTALTPLIGSSAPSHVEWSPNRDAVLVQVEDESYIATVSGAVYDITSIVKDNPMVSWVSAGFPNTTVSQTLPQPIAVQETATPITITVSSENGTPPPAGTLFVPQTQFVPGQLLQVAVDSVSIYTEPIIGAEVVADLAQGEALVLIGGPLTDGVTVWWRVQTLDFVGWAEEAINGITQFSS